MSPCYYTLRCPVLPPRRGLPVAPALAVYLFCEVVRDNFSDRSIAEEPSVGDVGTNETFELECKNSTGLQGLNKILIC